MSTYYGPFSIKEPSTPHEEHLVSFGVDLIGTPDGVSWYDIREELKKDQSNKKIVVMDQDYAILTVFDIELIDTFSPNAMIVVCVDKLPSKFDGEVGKWKFIKNKLSLNSDYVQSNLPLIIDTEVQYASSKIEHLQDLLDIEDQDSDLDEVKSEILSWKAYRVKMKKIETLKSLDDLPARPE